MVVERTRFGDDDGDGFEVEGHLAGDAGVDGDGDHQGEECQGGRDRGEDGGGDPWFWSASKLTMAIIMILMA